MNEAVKIAKYEAKARRAEALAKLGSQLAEQGLEVLGKVVDQAGKIAVEAVKTPAVAMVGGVVLTNYFRNKEFNINGKDKTQLIGDVDAAAMRAIIVSAAFINVFVPKLPDLSGLFGK